MGSNPTLLNSTRLYSTLLNSTQLYSTLLNYTQIYSTLPNSTQLYSTQLYSTLLNSTQLYTFLLNSTQLSVHAFTIFRKEEKTDSPIFRVGNRHIHLNCRTHEAPRGLKFAMYAA